MAQSWGLVCYLMGMKQKESKRKEYVKRFKKLSRGLSGLSKKPEEQLKVVEEVYGIPADKLYARWRNWLLKDF